MRVIINDINDNLFEEQEEPEYDMTISSLDTIPDDCTQLGIYTKKPIHHLKFPDKIRTIKFHSKLLYPSYPFNYYDHLIEQINFPPNLKILYFANSFKSFNKNLQNIKINDDCTLMFDDNYDNYVVNNLPSNLKKLYIGCLYQPLLNLPYSLELFQYVNEGKNYLTESKFPFGCIIEKVD
jgi:hypothetical protein